MECVLGNRVLFGFEVLMILAISIQLALWFRPEPHSDWAYYWAAAGDVTRYERGGLSLWLLAIPKALGWSPLASALALNCLAALLLLCSSRALDPTAARWFGLLVALYLLLITPFFSIVQLDMLAAAQLAVGVWLLASPPSRWSRRFTFFVAAVMIAAGVSTKPQYALTLWAMLGLFVAAWLVLKRRMHPFLPILFAVLLAGSVTGFTIDLGLRALSGRSEAIRTNSAVTLYSGLLVSGTGPRCGYWSAGAAEAAKADLSKPLHHAVLDRLAQKPPTHWISVIGCKLPEIFRPGPYALYWLVESPNIRTRIDADPRRTEIDAAYRRALWWESHAYSALTLSILAMAAFTCIAMWRNAPLLALLPVLWITSFWVVHIVFEIQGRYFLGIFLLVPLLCSIALRVPRGVCGQISPKY
ncbi:hypothetical protein [Luteimonas cucumeris]|nr:hypothetical protein [Luteimonas cucumeris]